MFRRAGCDPALLHVPETRISNRVKQRLYEVAERETGDACFGIEVGKQVRGIALHALGEAIARAARHTRVLTDFFRVEVRDEPHGVRLIVVFADPRASGPLSRHDAVLAGCLKMGRITFGDAFAPLEATVERAPPACAHRFHEWFRAPIVCEAPYPSLLCRREDLDRPLVTANPGVASASDRLMTDYLARLDRGDVAAQVKSALIGRLPVGAPTQATIARALGIEYLRRSDYSVGEVAYLLGFAEASSFNRAFRRWTGRSPSEFRQAQAAAAP